MRFLMMIAAIAVAIGFQAKAVVASDASGVSEEYHLFRGALKTGDIVEYDDQTLRKWAGGEDVATGDVIERAQLLMLGANAIMELEPDRTREVRRKIEDNLREALSLLEDGLGQNSPDISTYYSDIGQMYLRLYRIYPSTDAVSRRGTKLFAKAAKGYQKLYKKEPAKLAAELLEIVERMHREDDDAEYGKHLMMARSLIRDMGDPVALDVEQDYWHAMASIGNEHYDRARRMLEEGLENLNKVNGSDTLKLKLHGALVSVYQSMGDEEGASKHCIAASDFTGRVGDKAMRPLYIEPLDYSGLGRKAVYGGAVVSFTVDERGIVRNPIFLSGPEPMEAAVLKAISRFRFAPRIEDGIPVATEGVQYEFTFLDSRFRDRGQRMRDIQRRATGL